MATGKASLAKRATLQAARALNPRPQAVTDAAFTAGNLFFDPRDLVQVKYEMLRRVRTKEQRVAHAAAAFGFSRPTFYAVQKAFQRAGLVGLLPLRRGPRRAHKLTREVMTFIERTQREDPSLRPSELADRLKTHLGVTVHPRTLERRLRARLKKGRRTKTRTRG